MAVVRWDPFRELMHVQDRLSRMLSETRRGDDEVMTRGDWVPPVDIYQSDDHELVLQVELPGIKREDIDLRVENNTLTIRGERKLAPAVKEEQYHRIERAYGAFTRSFSLPQTVDAGKVRAEYRDGVLTVALPTREEAKPKQVQVQIS